MLLRVLEHHELHGAVREDPQAVHAVAAEQALHALLAVHLLDRVEDAVVVRVGRVVLHLQQDLHALEGRDHGARDRASDAAGDERHVRVLLDERFQGVGHVEMSV